MAQYKIFWGIDENTKLSEEPITVVQANEDSSAVYDFPVTVVPKGATHLLIVPVEDQGNEIPDATMFLKIEDKGPPTHAAQAISFIDTDLNNNLIGGAIVINPANDESDITHYVLYWGTDHQTKVGNAKNVQLAEKHLKC